MQRLGVFKESGSSHFPIGSTTYSYYYAAMFRHSLRLLVFLLLASNALVARAVPLEYIPTGHLAYEDLEALFSTGYADSIALETRPLTRIDIAAALLRVERRDSAVTRNPVYQRLVREFAREYSALGGLLQNEESGRLVDLGPDARRLRVIAAGHIRGDYDPERVEAHFRLRDESSAEAHATLQFGSSFALFEDIGFTRIRSQRIYIDPIVNHTDLEIAVHRAGLIARSGPITALAGYDQVRWGPGRRGTLLLSDAAGPMTLLTLTGTIGSRVTASAITGVLSRVDGRYLAAHRVEMILSKRVTLGLGEAVRYPGENIDLLYAAGIFPYAIVERTHIRDASSDAVRGAERANIMASMDVVVRLGRGLSPYGEILLDDIATENRDMPNRFGYQVGTRVDRVLAGKPVHGTAEYTRVRRFTYSTEYSQNFIYRDRPLGFALGPDVENLLLEGRVDLNRDWQVRTSAEVTRKGEGALGEAWQTAFGFVSTSDLLGVIERTDQFWGDLRWVPGDRLDLSLGLGHRRLKNERHLRGNDCADWLARLSLDVRY